MQGGAGGVAPHGANAGLSGNTTPTFTVAIEGKGPRDPLDRPHAGRRMSAVDQAYRYAINLPCDWIVVTSMRQTRLYFKGADQHTYERFDIERLADDAGQLAKLVYLLGAERVVPAVGRCHLYDLHSASQRVGRDLTKAYYVRYGDMRQEALDHLCRANPDVAREELLRCTQKLLDRVLFCAFCEDRSLLPEETIRKAWEHRDPYHPRPIWENFRGLFRAIDEGNTALNIPAYNGGLFAADESLDGLNIPDGVCTGFRDLAEYDYRPAHEVALTSPAHSPPLQGGAGGVAPPGNHARPQELQQQPQPQGSARRRRAASERLFAENPSREAATIRINPGLQAADRPLVDVDILGHIFEQSISDLELLRNELEGLTPPQGKDKHKTRRKKEGAFYTPAFITRYIVEQTLGSVLAERFEMLRASHAGRATGTAAKALADPRVYDLDAIKAAPKTALVKFWEAWQDELATVRVLDPACGSGAFLIEAFDQLYAAYQISNDRLEELRGQRTLFDLDRQILQNNLYGVDLNEEAIEICRLSLWIKTAARGKVLTSLDHTIRVGNSVVSDPAVHARAFDWQGAFPEVFERGGFDVVLGNPPYVRQALLGPIMPFLQTNYRSFHGMADLYVYFYEQGFRVLRSGGRLSFVVTNKWMKAGYGEPLRRFFAEDAWTESIVDFGHAKQIFEDVDVFPSIIVLRKPTRDPKPCSVRVCAIPREQLRIDDLSSQIESEGFELPAEQLGADTWQLEPRGVNALMAKLRSRGITLADFVGAIPRRGIVTGLNEAFLIDKQTRLSLIASDPNSESVIRPYFRGQDVDRWQSEWRDTWMIFARKGIAIDEYPAIKIHLEQFRQRLEPKPRGWSGEWLGRATGRYQWFELQMAVEHWREYERPKIVYQEIQFHPSYSLDTSGYLATNKVFYLPSDDLFLLSVLNSPLMWWHNWRHLPHMKDEALSPAGFLMESVPIVDPTTPIRREVEVCSRRLVEITQSHQGARRAILDWLRIEYEIDKPSLKLQSPLALDPDGLIAEVKRIRGRSKPLTAAGLKALRDEDSRTLAPARRLAAEALSLEHQVSDLVNAAYGLTPAEVDLMWATAPPRMPIGRQ